MKPVRPPTACIWCLADPHSVTFNMSHVVPASCGNADVVLPPPAVCERCNSSFAKLERTFAAEPLFNAVAATLGVANARTGKRFTHDQFGIGEVLSASVEGSTRTLGCEIVEGIDVGRLTVRVNITLDGRPLPVPRSEQTTELTIRWLSLYSRALHKIMFEYYAYAYYVTGKASEYTPAPTQRLFNPVRDWVRRGLPQGHPWPVMRAASGIYSGVAFGVDPKSLVAQLDLLGVQYAACLLPGGEAALRSLVSNAPRSSVVFAEQPEVVAQTAGPDRVVGTWQVDRDSLANETALRPWGVAP